MKDITVNIAATRFGCAGQHRVVLMASPQEIVGFAILKSHAPSANICESPIQDAVIERSSTSKALSTSLEQSHGDRLVTRVRCDGLFDSILSETGCGAD